MQAHELAALQRVGTTMKTLVQLLVDDEAGVVTEMRIPSDGSGATFRVRVPASEAGKVIGKQGRTARSLRILLQAISRKSQVSITLDIDTVEPQQRRVA